MKRGRASHQAHGGQHNVLDPFAFSHLGKALMMYTRLSARPSHMSQPEGPVRRSCFLDSSASFHPRIGHARRPPSKGCGCLQTERFNPRHGVL
ncbi:hypothetical protein PCANC_03599 [Puccinia coronata f. sp. avenae]|uniref:Uncharacterized protein n=1 Tax=Puccinia coronata f. sp. avenae TaxID=200324 RepID=A0A2N5VUX6_9BASI|nr:hypothetical protein PCANC_03599 [Puccinia coronata f. sp. avenae]